MKSVKYIIGSSLLIAGMIFSLTTPRTTTAQDGGQAVAPSQIGTITPSIAPAPNPIRKAKLLYFAPAENRNIALDEGMIDLRRKGFQVVYVTGVDQFMQFFLDSSTDAVLVVDIPENVLQSEVLSGRASEYSLIVRTTTGGKASSSSTSLAQFTPGGGGFDTGSSTDRANAGGGGLIPFGCLIEFLECRFGCICTAPFTDNRRLCDQCCNGCLASCENAQPCFQVKCCPDGDDQD